MGNFMTLLNYLKWGVNAPIPITYFLVILWIVGITVLKHFCFSLLSK